MASVPVFYDRVSETSTTTGTGTYTLAGAETGYQSFAGVGNGNSCYYCAYEISGGVPSGGWEVGLGTYTTSGTTLSRDSILASSNSGSAVNWGAGTRRVILTVPADLMTKLMLFHGDEIAITGATTATIGRMHVCSGTSADYTVTLPATSGNAGKLIGFRMAPIASLSKLVTLDGNASEKIDGATTRIMWAGESAILRCDGTDWFKIAGASIPMVCSMHLSSNQGSVATATVTKINVDTSDTDNTGVMADTTNKRINIKRAANYECCATPVMQGSAASTATSSIVQKNGTTNVIQALGCTAGANYYYGQPGVGVVALAAGDNVQMMLYHSCGSNQTALGGTVGTGVCTLYAEEIPAW